MDIHQEVDGIVDGIVDGGRPRNSGPWRAASVAVIDDLRGLASDPEIAAGIAIVTLMAGTKDGGDLARQAFDELIAIAAGKAPVAAHCLQGSGLGAYLAAQVVARAHYEAGDLAGGVQAIADMAMRLGLHHFPGNPAQLHPDGSVTTTGDMKRTDFMEIADHHVAQRPAGKPGRKRGSPKPKGSGAPPIPLARARAVRDMKNGGATNKAIALKHYPKLKPDSGAARMQVIRDCERARLAD